MKRILFFLSLLPYLAMSQVAKDTVTVLTMAQIPAGNIRDTTNFTFVQDNAFRKATFDSLARYTRVKLIGDRGDITVSGATGLTWELDTSVVDSMQLSAGAVVLPGAKVTGTLPVTKGGTGQSSLTANKVLVGNGTSAVLQPTNLHWDNSNERLGIGTASPGAKFAVSQTTSVPDAIGYNVVNTTTASSGFNNYASNITNNIEPGSATSGTADYASMNIASILNNNNSGTARFVYGLQASAYSASANPTQEVIGGNFGAGLFGIGNLTNATANRAIIMAGADTITNAYGYRFAGRIFVPGKILNAYGVYINNVNFGLTSNFSIYSEGGDNYLGGELQVGGASSFADGTTALPSVTNTGDTDTGIYFPEANGVGVSTNATERIRIKPNGQVRFIPLAAAPGTPQYGDIYYHETDHKLRVYTRVGGVDQWVDLH